MNSANFLDQLQAHYGVDSDRKLAAATGWERTRISHYRTGKRAFNDATCIEVAETLAVPSGYVLAEIQADRTKDKDARRVWRAVAATLVSLGKKGTAIGVGAMAIIVLSSGASDEAFSIQAFAMPLFTSQSIHYAHMYVFTVLVAALLAMPIILPLLFNWTHSGEKNENRVTLAGVRCRYVARRVQGGTR